MQNNKLDNLEGLQQLPGLKVLNVSQNHLTSLAGIEACTELNTLICSSNKLVTLKSVQSLRYSLALTTLDVQDNQLNNAEVLSLATALFK